MRIGLFGGTFDPVHFGHIHLAVELKERANLDLVIVMPAFLSPHKVDRPPIASPKERLLMTKMAFKLEGFTVSNYEIKKEGISYTIDTARYLKNLYKEDELFLLLSDEAYLSLNSWKDSKELLSLLEPLVGKRKKQDLPSKFFDLNVLEISSTQIRERLKKGLSCTHLVPGKVLDYIKKHHLYC